ncbi:prisilkin-39 [Penaeus vannamei]|uniref:prisilkin-39 n=1 Tax=Penaeus vannamei TaxID=6689 RepID=UPI00387F6AB3
MKLFLVTVSAALLCSHAFAASSYLGLAQGTPLGGFSQHGTLHGGLIPSGLYGNGASLVNHGLPLGHLPGPIYGSGGYLDYAYGTGAHFGNPYEKARFLKYLYGNPLGLANPYGALRNVGVGGVNEAEDETSSTSGAGATSGADFVSNNQIGDFSLTGISGLHSSPIAGLGGFHSALLPHTSSVALGTHPYALGPHTSIAALGGFPYAAGHHDSLSAFSGILPNVGAAGQFPYGLQPHTPIDYLTGFPYAGGPHAPLPASTGFHAGLGPYPSLAGLGGLSPYVGPYAAGAGFGRFNTAFGQNIPSDALRYRSSLNMSSGNMNNQEAHEE